MARQRSELLTGRNLAVVGGLVAVSTAIGYGVSRLVRDRRAERPDINLTWDYVPFEPKPARLHTDLSELTGKDARRSLGVFAVDAHAFDEQLSRAEGLAAVAVLGQNGLWHAGVVDGHTEFARGKDGLRDVRTMAMGMGERALHSVLLGVMDESQFVPFDTELVATDRARNIRHDFPGVPVVAEPPIELLLIPAEEVAHP